MHVGMPVRVDGGLGNVATVSWKPSIFRLIFFHGHVGPGRASARCRLLRVPASVGLTGYLAPHQMTEYEQETGWRCKRSNVPGVR